MAVGLLMFWGTTGATGDCVEVTIDFGTVSSAPVSYTEDGFTWTSLYPSGGHLHIGNNSTGIGSGSDLYNHSSCCSTPYELTKVGGGTFTLDSFEYEGGGAATLTSSAGGSVALPSSGTGTVDLSADPDFVDVTWVRWDVSSYGVMDNVVIVCDNTPPTITCPEDVSVECTGPDGTTVEYDPPTVSDDEDSDPEVTCSPASGSEFPLGDTTVTCTATDDAGNSASCSFTVSVVDTTPPSIASVSASPDTLWPPNHEMVGVSLSVSASDTCDDDPTCQILSVTSNEPIEGLGDGDTSPDWEITGDLTVDLRAERSGTGTGRVYTITVECTDGEGNSSTSTVTVSVPHSKKK